MANRLKMATVEAIAALVARDCPPYVNENGSGPAPPPHRQGLADPRGLLRQFLGRGDLSGGVSAGGDEQRQDS